MKQKLILISGLIILMTLASGCIKYSEPKCGIENCHGLDITCGPDVGNACTEIYELGDNCRQYAQCEIIDGNCKLAESKEFDACRSCVKMCLEYNHELAFECENACIDAITPRESY